MTTYQRPTGKAHRFGLADRLRAAREDAGLTVRDLEAATGISRSSIGNYENGHTAPRRPQLAAWALATGFDMAWLEAGEDSDDDNGARHTRTDVCDQPLVTAA